MDKYKYLQEIKSQGGYCRGMLCTSCCLGLVRGDKYCLTYFQSSHMNKMSNRYSDRLLHVNRLLRVKKLERICKWVKV